MRDEDSGVRRGWCIQEPRFSLIEQLEGDLDLARGPGGLADDAEARADHDVGRQSKVNEVKNIEKLGAKLQRDGFAPTAVGKLRVRDIKDGGAFFSTGIARTLRRRLEDGVRARTKQPWQWGT